MSENKLTDWMLVTVTKYDTQKGYIYGKRNDTGKSVIIAKKNSVRFDWAKNISNPKLKTHAPINSIIAVYGANEIDPKTGFNVASWVTAVSKRPNQEDVFVTPIKVMDKPRKTSTKANKNEFIDAVVMDSRPVAANSLQEIADACLKVLDKNCSTSFNLDGSRGFMIRLGHSDGNLADAKGWEFFGRVDNAPADTWNYYWNQQAQKGMQYNKLRAILHAAKKVINDQHGFVEVVGLSKVTVNDFGSIEKVNELAALPNYKTVYKNKNIPAYSLAAITVEKQSKQRIIKQQFPLPKEKVINHIAGMLGNHIPRLNPVQSESIKVTENKNQAISSPAPSNMTPAQSTRPPLAIEDYVNESGKVLSVHVTGTKNNLDKFRARIENAVASLTPLSVKGGQAFSFPVKYKNVVSSSLSDLTGAPAIFLEPVQINGDPHIVIAGRVHEEPYASAIRNFFQKNNLPFTPGKPSLIPEKLRITLINDIKDLLNTASVKSPSVSPISQTNAIQQSPSKPKQSKAPKKKRISYAEWQQAKFGKSPGVMMGHFDPEIRAFAEEAGIDWDRSQSALVFGAPGQKATLARSGVMPLKKSHKGSVAVSTKVYETRSTKDNSSTISFTIAFYNKMAESSKEPYTPYALFNSYEYAFDAYMRDMDAGVNTSRLDSELEALKKASQAREAEARAVAKKEEEKAAKSRLSWARKFPSMSQEDGTNALLIKKGIPNVVNSIDIRRGQDYHGEFIAYQLFSIGGNYMGVQQLYNAPISNEKGKQTNKKFIHGTLFKDVESGQHYGTHAVVGEIAADKPIYFTEGLSDAGTGNELTNAPHVICLNKGNMDAVIRLFREKHPDKRLIIISDNDAYNLKKGNGGFCSTLDAARKYGAEYILPNFEGLPLETSPKDLNDLRAVAGNDQTRKQILDPQVPPDDVFEYHKLYIQHVGTEKLKISLDSAVKEIIANGKHGTNEEHINRVLAMRAVMAYGKAETAEALGDSAKNLFDVIDTPEPQNVNTIEETDNTFPISLSEEESSVSKKKYLLIKDHTNGEHKQRIESAIKKIVGPSHLPYNESLQGWVTPNVFQRVINSYLHDITGAAQLYIGRSRSKSSDMHFVVRGDFSNQEFKDRVYNRISYAHPKFQDSDFGFILPDNNALPYIKESLKDLLTPKSKKALAHPTLEQDTPETKFNASAMEEAKRVSGLNNSEITFAHFRLVFNEAQNIFLDDDFVFSAIYGRAIKGFTHLEPDAQHLKGLEEARRNVRNLLATGVDNDVLTPTSRVRLEEIATHLEYFLDKAPDDPVFNETELKAIDATCTESKLNKEDVITFISGNKHDLSQKRRDVIRSYQRHLLESYKELNVTENSAVINADEIEHKPINLDEERAKELLDLTRTIVEKGFDEEEFYDLFLTQRNSMYFIEEKGGFQKDIFNRDLKYLSTANNIDGWKPAKISTASGLYSVIYNDVAKNRLRLLEEYVNSYLDEKSETTYKSFSKYFHGEYQLKSSIMHPYFDEGEVNEETLSRDLEYLTEYPSLAAYYRDAVDAYTGEVTQETLFEEADYKPVNKHGKLHREVIKETTQNNDRGTISKYSLDDLEIYEITSQRNSKGRWATETHNFANSADSAKETLKMTLSNQEVSKDYKQSLPVNEIASDKTPSNEISHLEVDSGDLNVYAVIDSENVGGIWEQQTVGLWSEYALSRNSYQQLYREKIEKYQAPEIENKGQAKILRDSKNINTDAKTIGAKIKSWAKENYSTIEVFEMLESQLNIKLSPENSKLISKQYQQLVDNHHSSNISVTESASSLYDALHQETVSLVKSDLTYDEFIDEFFKTDGSLVSRNPYYDQDANSINKKQAFEDIRAAGYKSIFNFYESQFEGIHHRSSNDVIIGRIGGFIPDRFNDLQPIRPQFENIKNVLDSNESIVDTLPPFKEWVNSLDRVRSIHPIISEELDIISAEDLAEKYSRDEVLLLADIHGVAVSPESTKKNLTEQVIRNWNTRSMLSKMSYEEAKDLHVDTVVDLMKDMGLPANGRHTDRVDRMLAHIEKLKATSELRIAQYSYIRTAIELEENNKKIPSYALKDISTFISNETEFKAVADEAVLRASKATLRKRIDLCSQLMFPEMDSVTRAVLSENKNNKNTNIIGAPGTDYINLGKYTYYINSDYDTDRIKLPKSVAYHATYSDKVFATPAALDSKYLISNTIIPISKAAISHSSAPVNLWMDTYGYAAFRQSDGETLHVAYKGEKSWAYDTYKNGNLVNSKSYVSAKSLLDNNILNIDGFVDRDFICEEYLAKFNPNIYKIIDKLNDIAKASLDRNNPPTTDLSKITDPKIIGYLDLYKKEGPDIQLHRVCRELTKKIKENLLASVFEKDQTIDANILKSAEQFTTTVSQSLIPPKSDLSTSTKHLWQYEPTEACKAYAELTNKETDSIFTPYIESHYNNLSSKQKNELGLEITAGTYESIGHYLHECAVKEAALKQNAEAINAYNKYYAENNSVLSPVKEPDSNANIQKGDCVFLTSINGESSFGIVTEYSDKQIKFKPTTTNDFDPSKLPPMIREELIAKDGTYLFALPFNKFKERPEAIALDEQLDIDPCSPSGRAKLSKLPLVELRNYAQIIGGNYKADRQEMLNSIHNIADAKIIINHAIKGNTPELSFEEKSIISEASGISIESKTFADDSIKWQKEIEQHTLVSLTEQNYNNIQTLAKQFNLPTNTLSNSKKHAQEITLANNELFDVRPFNNNQDTSFYFRNAPSVKQLLSEASSTDVDVKANAIWALNLLNTDTKRLDQNIKRLPPGYNIVPTIEQNEVVWFLADKTGKVDPLSASSSPEDTIDTKKNIPSLDEVVLDKDSLIAWKDLSNGIQFGWVAKNTHLCEENVVCIHQDHNGHEYVSDIPAENIVQVNEQLWNTIADNRISKINGNVTELLTHFNNELKNIPKINNLYTQTLEAYVCKKAFEHIDSVKTVQSALPANTEIIQINGMFEIQSDSNNNPHQQFETLNDLIKTQTDNTNPVQDHKNEHAIAVTDKINCNKSIDQDKVLDQNNEEIVSPERPKSKGMGM